MKEQILSKENYIQALKFIKESKFNKKDYKKEIYMLKILDAWYSSPTFIEKK